MSIKKALKQSMTALDDWINIFAETECSPERVEEARQRISEKGTLGYIAEIQDYNRKALASPHEGLMRKCPFCGHVPNPKDNESVHPITIDKSVWRAGCVSIHGGCDGYVLGDSEENAIENWNKRT